MLLVRPTKSQTFSVIAFDVVGLLGIE